jgi:hypothetical protein
LGLISLAERDAFLALIDGRNGIIASLDALPGVYVFDLAGRLRDIAGDPEKYALVDLVTPFGFAGVYVPTGGACTDTFLFWDGAVSDLGWPCDSGPIDDRVRAGTWPRVAPPRGAAGALRRRARS